MSKSKIRKLATADYSRMPLTVMPGDTISAIHDGHTVATHMITDFHQFTEVVIFEADEGVFGKGRALGGAFVEGERKPR